MKKHIKKLIGYICFGVIVSEYLLGLIKTTMVNDWNVMVITSIACLICMLLLTHYVKDVDEVEV